MNFRVVTLILSIFILGVAAPACADVFIPAVQHDDKYFLDGTWKYMEGDSKTYSAKDFDDSKWKNIKVPGTIRKADTSAVKVTWYRRKFTPTAGKNFGWLLLTQVLDEGEVWLNGEKLSFPMYQAPMEFSQPGLYQKLWPLDWPTPFMIWGILKPGKENVLAVRVSNFPNYRNMRIASHEGPAYNGDTGISGNVYLAAHPDIFIRTMERSVLQVNGKKDEQYHCFFLFVESFARDAVDAEITLEIRNEKGKVVFVEDRNITVLPGGDIVDFKWNATSDYQKYEAVATLSSKSAKRNVAKLAFHNVKVEALNGALFVNGSRFVVKGINGTPGLHSEDNLPGSAVLDSELLKKDIQLLSGIGINTLRTSDPVPELMKEAERLGVMVVPVISSDWSRTVVALREYQNILYWELEINTAQDLAAALEATKALDIYDRPVSYYSTDIANSEKVNPGGDFQVTGLEASNGKLCGGANAQYSDKVVILNGWGVGAKSDSRYMALTVHEKLHKDWLDCVESGKTAGAIYKELVSGTGYFPSLRRLYSENVDPLLAEILKTIFSDFKVSIINVGGGRKDVVFTPSYGVEATELNIHSVESGKLFASTESISSGKSIRASLGQNPFSVGDMKLEYNVLSGIEHEYIFNPSEPVLWGGEAWFNQEILGVVPGVTSSVALRIVGDGVTRKALVTLEASSPGISLSPVSRGVTVPGNGDVDVPFRVSAGAGAEGWGYLTAIVSYSDAGRLPYKLYLPVEFR